MHLRLKKAIIVFFVLFSLVNAVAFFHAWRFTHFVNGSYIKKKPEQMTASEKMQAVCFGVKIGRPINKTTPDVPYETIRLNCNGVTLEGWYTPTEQPKGTVIIFHGYSGCKAFMLDKADLFQELGYNTLNIDFQDSGGSTGSSTTIGFEEGKEVETAYSYIQNKNPNKNQKIYLFGTSMGAAAILKALDYAALNHIPTFRPNGVIIECPFGTMRQTVASRFHNMHLPAFPLSDILLFWGGVQNGFNAFAHNPQEYAKSTHCPTLLMWGEKDLNVSRMETEAIFQNLQGEKQLVTFPLAGHENYLVKYRKEWTNAVNKFLQKE